jgi:SAM-dependent methyltransferase
MLRHDGAVTRWSEATGGGFGREYAQRFARLAESGADVDGEAQLCASLAPPGSRVLDAGCGTGRVMRRLVELGYDCVGVDLDDSMLAEARAAAPELRWLRGDLAALDLPASGVAEPFDLVVCAGNVVPLLAVGTEATTVAHLAAHVRAGGLLVAGFGLDAAHLPMGAALLDLESYDRWCTDAGLTVAERFATWDREPYAAGAGYAVSVHRRLSTVGDVSDPGS